MREIRSYLNRGDSRPSGYVTVSKRNFQADDEKVGTVGNKHAKVYQLKDAPAIGLSHTTNY
jgi:hypothetical protein